ncbi:MAG: DNA adenine methylase, partial [Chloroflexi bacterium]|nr:DNA adenine methylase [Chloroflexota bacterium]
MGYRYIGSKADLIQEILLGIAEAAPPGSHVADLMSGTGRVAAALRQHGYQVTAADVMTYSLHHARVALLLNEPPKFENASEFLERDGNPRQKHLFHQNRYERMIEAINSVEPVRGYFWREFSRDGRPRNGADPRNYFSPDNAQKIDGIRGAILVLANSGSITELDHSLLIHD